MSNLTNAAAGEIVGMCFLSQPRYFKKQKKDQITQEYEIREKLRTPNWMSMLCPLGFNFWKADSVHR